MSIYRGNCLRVDMTRHETSKELTPGNGIGGRTWNSVTLLEELEPGIDPLGPDNVLCIAVGPLTGSKLIGSCRFIASAKSPLTGYHGDSGARGFFASCPASFDAASTCRLHVWYGRKSIPAFEAGRTTSDGDTRLRI